MTEIIVSIAAKVSEHLVNLTIRQGQYLFRVSKIMKNLESAKKELASTHDHIQKKAEEATHKAEEVNYAVSTWLNEVMELIREVEQLEKEVLVYSSSCLRGKFPTRNRYILCKQMEKKTEAMMQLNKRCHFEPFSFPAPIPDIEHFSSGNFEYFKSTRLAADQLLDVLQDDSSYIIGLYGMGGSGKTALVKEVGKKAKQLKLFDHVVFTTVSQSPNIMKIQDEIADLLGLKLDEKSEAGKARRISVRLQSGERILIILDDVWTKLNLEDIGIPVDGNLKGCKVLLTTRRQDVCNLMDCLKRIPLDLLSEEEAWSLFQKHAGIDAALSSNSLNNMQLQREVCKECKGLPIAIVTVGSSLKGKSNGVDEWKVALQSLRDSKPVDVDEGVGDAFNCLKLSYDYLKRDDTKLLFLICSMFPEDHEILVDDLIKYGVGLGICGGKFELASTQLRTCINKLVDSSLLMLCELSKVDQIFRHKKERVKMHDMVRDVALWIASKDRAIMVDLARNLNTLIESEAAKDCYALSSWYNNGIDELLHRLDAPKLQILLVNLFAHTIPLGLTDSLELSNESFQGLKELKVLALINKNCCQKVAISFPQSLQTLTNLQTLRLVGWDLGDISFVVSLKRLKILDLQDSKFKGLPNGITMLDKLKLLDLSKCKIEESCFEVIRRCSQLEELYAFNYGDCSNPRIMDHYQFFGDDDVTFPNLQRYKLYLGPLMSCPFEMHSSSKKNLFVNGFNPSASDAFVKYLLQRTLDVRLYDLHGGCKNIFPATVQAIGCMNEMTHLQLIFCSELECLVDSTSNNADKILLDATFPELVELCLERMDNLKELWRGPFLLCFFEKLQVLRMASCNQLHNIFPRECDMRNLKKLSIVKCRTLTSVFLMRVARTLVKLECLIIKECSELRYIINNEQEDGTDTEDVTVHMSYDSHEMLPELKELTISSCDKLEFILPKSCAEGLLQLRKLQVSLAPKLKYIFGQCHNEDQLSYLNSTKMVLPQLEEIELQSLPELLGIFSGKYNLSWKCLKKLTWRNCPKLRTNSSHNNLNFDLEHQQLPPNTETHLGKECLTSKLERLSLLNVHDLRFIWTASTLTQILRLQHLQYLTVTRCRKLKSIFPSVIQRCLPELRELYVGNCEELEEIVAENEKYDNESIAQACFPKLTRIEVRRCNKLKSLFSIAIARNLPQLSSLIIVDSPQLKEIFRHGNEADPVDGEPLIFQNLKELRIEKLKSLTNVGIVLPPKELCKVRRHDCPNIGSSIVDSASSGNRGSTDESNE